MGEDESIFFFFFFNDTATTEIYTLSLHDALPICVVVGSGIGVGGRHGELEERKQKANEIWRFGLNEIGRAHV